MFYVAFTLRYPKCVISENGFELQKDVANRTALHLDELVWKSFHAVAKPVRINNFQGSQFQGGPTKSIGQEVEWLQMNLFLRFFFKEMTYFLRFYQNLGSMVWIVFVLFKLHNFSFVSIGFSFPKLLKYFYATFFIFNYMRSLNFTTLPWLHMQSSSPTDLYRIAYELCVNFIQSIYAEGFSLTGKTSLISSYFPVFPEFYLISTQTWIRHTKRYSNSDKKTVGHVIPWSPNYNLNY